MLTGDLSISCFQNTDIVTYEYVYEYICICIYIIYIQFLVFLNRQNARFYGGLKVSIIIEMRCHPSQR